MAALGSVSPASPNGKSIDRLLQEAQVEGKLHISRRKLKCLPKSSTRYDLRDTTDVDLSWNRLSDIPRLVCEFHSMQTLKCSHNVIKSIPSVVCHLTNLRHLDLSRNHLSHLPIAICRLQSLEVLLVASNRLVSIPEEISMLQKLTELDVSCNQLTCLPAQLCDLKSIRVLNARHNLLLEIPVELYRLQLRILDLSGNKLRYVPHQYQLMNTLEDLNLDSNPLISPPANLCSRGIEHVMKFLVVESKKEARRRGSTGALHQSESGSSPGTCHRFVGGVRCDLMNGNGSDQAPESGYGTVESLPSSSAAATPVAGSFPERRPSSASSCSSSHTASAASVSTTATGTVLSPRSASHTPSGSVSSITGQDRGGSPAEDEFSRQLERARSAYANQKRRASQVKMEFARQQQQLQLQQQQQQQQQQQLQQQQMQQQQQQGVYNSNSNNSAGLDGSPVNGQSQQQTPTSAQPMFSSSQTVMQRLEAQLHRGQRSAQPSPVPSTLSTLTRPGRSSSAGHNPQPSASSTSNGIRGWSSSSRSVDPNQVRSASVELRSMIESRLKIRLPDEVGSALRDGVILCHLVNQLRPRSVYSVHVPSPGQPMLGLAKCRRNVENFLEACRRLGVPEACMCAPEDVLIFQCPCTTTTTSISSPAATPAGDAVHSTDDISLFRVADTVYSLIDTCHGDPATATAADRLRVVGCLFILAIICFVFAALKAILRPYEERASYYWWSSFLQRGRVAADDGDEYGLLSYGSS